MNLVDTTFANLSGKVPWTVHAEWAAGGRLDVDRLSSAARATVREHPMLGARQVADDAWLLFDDEPSPPLEVRSVGCDDELSAVRDQLVSRPFDVRRETPLRVALIRSAAGDHVVAVADHAAVDGIGIGRTLATLMEAYGPGRPTGAVDQRWRDAHELAAAPPPPERVAETVGALRARALPGFVRLAREHAVPVEGCGVVYHEVSCTAADTLACAATDKSTRNDIVVAAFVLACMAWNRSVGAAHLPFSVGVPLNLRSARSWFDGVCNAVIPWPVRIDSDDPAEALRQVSAQLRPVRAGLYSTDVRALLAALAGQRGLSVRARHTLATTTVVSTVPGGDILRAGSLRNVPARGLQGGAPCPPSMGITFAVIQDLSRYRFSARFLRSHHTGAGATRLLASVEDAVDELCRSVDEELR